MFDEDQPYELLQVHYKWNNHGINRWCDTIYPYGATVEKKYINATTLSTNWEPNHFSKT